MNFGHGDSSCHNRKPTYFDWDRRIYQSNVCFFTDRVLNRAVNDPSKVKVAWLYEPKAINPSMYQWIERNHQIFDYVLTHDKSLCGLSNKFLFYPHGGCWIKDEDMKVYNKTKKISIIASNKKQTVGHKLRHEVISEFGKDLDVYGRGYSPIDDKLEGLKEYQYHIVIENSKQDDYFTEKIIDCFATGTVPIYWGTNGIKKYFRDIITFDSISELKGIISRINDGEKITNNRVILNNFENAKKYKVSEDYFYEKYKFLFL